MEKKHAFLIIRISLLCCININMMLFFSLYNYKVFCTQYHNRALLQFGNCDPRYTEGIIASNRSILLPELDARLNDSVCNGKLHIWIMKYHCLLFLTVLKSFLNVFKQVLLLPLYNINNNFKLKIF